MVTVMLIPSTIRAIQNVCFITIALNIIQKDGTTSYTKISFTSRLSRHSETQLTADDITVCNIPEIITDCTQPMFGK
jgi:hypothetical protein